MSRELTLTADDFRFFDVELKAEVEDWLRVEGLWGEPKITHIHFYEGRIQARCMVGQNPTWTLRSSPHESPWLFQLETFPTKTPPPAKLIRHLMDVHQG